MFTMYLTYTITRSCQAMIKLIIAVKRSSFNNSWGFKNMVYTVCVCVNNILLDLVWSIGRWFGVPPPSPGASHVGERSTSLPYHWGTQVYVRHHSLKPRIPRSIDFPVHTGWWATDQIWTLTVIFPSFMVCHHSDQRADFYYLYYCCSFQICMSIIGYIISGHISIHWLSLLIYITGS